MNDGGIRRPIDLRDLPAPPLGRVGWPWTEACEPCPERPSAGGEWPLISVVTPVYNQAEFIEETIRSVLLQGYPRIEHVIVNDGSTDGTMEIVARYSAWVRCVTQGNRGQSAAANRGFRLAQGELVGWQNSDDMYGPGAFREGALAALGDREADVYNGTARGFQDGAFRPPWLFEECNEFRLEAFVRHMCAMNQSMFFRREIFEAGEFLREDFHYVMDQEYLWRLGILGYRFRLVPTMVGYYRQHGRAKSNSAAVRGDLERFRMDRELVRDRRLSPALRRAIRARLRGALWNSIRRSRRTILRKLVPELFWRVNG